MKTLAVVLIVLFAAPQAFAQETPQQAALLHKGNRKIWTGVVLIGAGALVLPVTDTKPVRSQDSIAAPLGIGLVFTGSMFIWSGALDRQKARKPQTALGQITFGCGFGSVARMWIADAARWSHWLSLAPHPLRWIWSDTPEM
jgi:hypothetical protein